MSKRRVLLVIHPDRPEAHRVAGEVASALTKEGFDFLSFSPVTIDGVTSVSLSQRESVVANCEVALVLGGDGTILRGAELVHGTTIPILGINLGHVGFLAQIGKPTPQEIIAALRDRSYRTEKRMSLSYKVERGKIGRAHV